MKKNTSLLLIMCLLMSACAKHSKDIQATYVSPLQYQDYSCKQIGMELMRVQRRVSEVSGNQDAQATKDNVAMGVGLIVFWPALFFLIGDDKKEEIGRLKGEYDALEQAAIQKECSIAKDIQQQRANSAAAATKAAEEAKTTKKNWN